LLILVDFFLLSLFLLILVEFFTITVFVDISGIFFYYHCFCWYWWNFLLSPFELSFLNVITLNFCFLFIEMVFQYSLFACSEMGLSSQYPNQWTHERMFKVQRQKCAHTEQGSSHVRNRLVMTDVDIRRIILTCVLSYTSFI
jgi:hypothetical protein